MHPKKVFEKIQITGPSGNVLESVLMFPQQCPPRRLVFIVPLVGSGAAQQLLRFKGITKRGSVLLSFEFSGHGGSTGTFSVGQSLDDSQRVCEWAEEYAAARNIPLHVLGTCYGALAMLSWFRYGRRTPAVKTLSAVSGLFSLEHILSVDGFLRYYEGSAGVRYAGVAQFLGSMHEAGIDVNGEGFRDALRDYLKALFPDLRITRDAFEELEYRRADIAETVKQFHTMRPLEGAAVPRDIPCLLFYGTRDSIMGLTTAEGRLRYESQIRALMPQGETRPVEIDHFGRGPDHDAVIHQLCDYYEQHDRAHATASCESRF